VICKHAPNAKDFTNQRYRLICQSCCHPALSVYRPAAVRNLRHCRTLAGLPFIEPCCAVLRVAGV
jgi:hypothetical protein